MNIATYSEKAVISRLRNNQFDDAIDLISSGFVCKDEIAPHNWVGELLDAKAPKDKVLSLLDKHPNLITQQDSNNNCVLFYVSKNHRLDILHEVKNLGVDIFKNINDYGSCMHVAARYDNPYFLRGLVALGFNHMEVNNRGLKPIDIAKRWANFGNVTFFDNIENNPDFINLIRKPKKDHKGHYEISI